MKSRMPSQYYSTMEVHGYLYIYIEHVVMHTAFDSSARSPTILHHCVMADAGR
jgi:hypothetical protein